MRELHTILAAINMSVLDDEVIKRAVLMAKETNAQLHFIHAIDIPVLDIEITSKFLQQTIDEESVKKKIVQKLDELNTHEGVEYLVHISKGDAAENVMHRAEKIRADLIIMGSHGKAKIEDHYFGSTADKIAENSGHPVLVVKNLVKGAYQNILAPTNLSDASRKSVIFAQKAFPSSPIKLVHAYEESEDLTLEFDELYSSEVEDPVVLGRPHTDIFKQEVGIENMDMLKSFSSINESLLEYINTKKSDLIILGSGGSDIAGSFLSSTASYLLRETASDALIYVPLEQTKQEEDNETD